MVRKGPMPVRRPMIYWCRQRPVFCQSLGLRRSCQKRYFHCGHRGGYAGAYGNSGRLAAASAHRFRLPYRHLDAGSHGGVDGLSALLRLRPRRRLLEVVRTMPAFIPTGCSGSGDDKLLMLGIQNEREWVAFCELVLGNAALAERFSLCVKHAALGKS